MATVITRKSHPLLMRAPKTQSFEYPTLSTAIWCEAAFTLLLHLRPSKRVKDAFQMREDAWKAHSRKMQAELDMAHGRDFRNNR